MVGKILVVIGFFLLIFGMVKVQEKYPGDIPCGECVCIKPLGNVWGGEIQVHYSLLGQSTDRYMLLYPGRCDYSGEDCGCLVRVTEKEYSRKLYGE